MRIDKLAAVTPIFHASLLLIAILFCGCAVNVHEPPVVQPTEADWGDVREQNFSLLIPRDLSKEDVTGVDSYYARYSDHTITIAVEGGAGSEGLDYIMHQERIQDFKKVLIERNGMHGTEAAYQFKQGAANFEDPDKTYVRSLSVDCRWPEESVTVKALYLSPEQENMAEKILNSVIVECKH